jgi:redox-sensitive bicupin YhaK (pirin superfamily)
MIRIRKAADRGGADHGWLNTRHTFSFADYYDPAHMGFRALRVINEDRVAPGTGFGAHPHRDMEIVTYVISGELEHQDSTGGGGVLRAYDVQHMTAGTGVVHSEVNPSPTAPVHLYQVWLLPERRGLTPGYQQRTFPPDGQRNAWRLAASHDGRDGSLKVHQDVELSLAALDAGAELRHDLRPGRHAWLQVVRGAVDCNGRALAAGDGAAVSDEAALTLRAAEPAEVLLFDLA